MNYLVLDTNIYISLCLKRVESVTAPCLKSLSDLLEKNQIKIVLPEIIKIEFLRNIESEFENSKKILNQVIKQIEFMILPHDIPNKIRLETIQNLRKILSKFNDISIQEQTSQIVNIMEHKNTVLIKTNDDLILKAFRRVVEKLAPAHQEKSEADCLILESIISYFSTISDKEKVFFITHNHHDFANPRNREEIHPQLVSSFNDLGISYSPHLAKILKEHFGQKIDEEDIKFEEDIIKKPWRQDLPLHGFWDPVSGYPFSNIGEEDSLMASPNSVTRYTDQTPSWSGDYGEDF